ncbi:MAG: PIN domain-containing protein [Myxococcales bacterium]|nr:PIN domain-containing protein [Myxococcales bacterium]
MIFVDSNIPMYLIGAPHPHKGQAQRLLDHCVRGGIRLVTDAEVFQEILHRYIAIHRREAIQPAYDALLGVVDEVLPIDLAAVQRAKEIVLGTEGLSTRDALHVAMMERHRIEAIMTFDRGFDRSPGIRRFTIT